MSRLIRKSHNVSILLYHAVFPAKYRRVVFDDAVESVLREVCIEISLRYEIEFIEIGTDGDHVHLLLQSVPTYSPTKIITLLKSLNRAPSVCALSSRQKAIVEQRVFLGRLLCFDGGAAGKRTHHRGLRA